MYNILSPLDHLFCYSEHISFPSSVLSIQWTNSFANFTLSSSCSLCLCYCSPGILFNFSVQICTTVSLYIPQCCFVPSLKQIRFFLTSFLTFSFHHISLCLAVFPKMTYFHPFSNIIFQRLFDWVKGRVVHLHLHYWYHFHFQPHYHFQSH